ncbi:RNA polymerase subunit sigma-24 [Pseudoxanthomonas broegbernensis]|uniref:RNA polymerase subunit sigma-24 n=1 Tax=Pseudoxanthomonas broegbernensis TaxID=83619 RepID=A0A7V8GPI9_9GAMM|nr:RNA polymerase sigma-70 factor [Pseudoxanthomonas broegbernensis]KAF1687652.1 RNA polymerase subunit sigma-24 [Pseudoxanthomonas broegbernensis]MBB6064678.1 RNA polymerase sigma-70 factor (ECF subfamily) [Pseudoxanthomonas broegbernensis]
MDTDDPFESHRPRLFALAYRMLGSRAEAEDVVQDTWLRWHRAGPATVRDPEAWLVAAATRLGIDRLRAARARRERYAGPWLPEPLRIEASDAAAGAGLEGRADDAPGPARRAETAQQVSLAFLAVLERLGPEERAAYLLREAFDYDHAQIAALLGRSEASCRQMVHRARERIQAGRPRFEVSPQRHRRLLERFMQAARQGDREAVAALLREDARLVSDGGGKALAAIRPLLGAERIARLFWAAYRRRDPAVAWRMGRVNGEPAILRYRDDVLVAAMVAVSDGERIAELLNVANPDKLGVTPPAAAASW